MPADVGVEINSVKVVINQNILMDNGLENLFFNRNHCIYIAGNYVFNNAVFKLIFTVNICCDNIPCVISAGHILKESEVVALATL